MPSFTEASDVSSADKFLQLLNEFSELRALCRIPLILVIVLDIFHVSGSKLPFEIYHMLIVCILQRESKIKLNNENTATMATSDDKVEALYKQFVGISKETASILLMLSELAYRSFIEWCSDRKRKIGTGDVIKSKEPLLLFTESDLIQCGGSLSTDFDGLGLMEFTLIYELTTDTYLYNFLHNTIQEFFALLYVSLLPQQNQMDSLNKMLDCSNNFKTWLSFASPLQKTVFTDCKLYDSFTLN